jgi:FSR family fosmidomycin resistance protein-like MFS transporter
VITALKFSHSSLLGLGHGVNDLFSNSLSGLLPLITIRFGLSYLLAGVVAMVLNVTSSVMQPLFGHWFDRTRVSWLLEAGLALNCVGMSLLGFSSSFVLLLFFVGTAGLGSAVFHPPAFSAVVKSSSSSRGKDMGVFLSAGNTGLFLGPFVAGAVGTALGLRGMILLLPLGLLVAVILLKANIRSEASEPEVVQPHRPANKRLLSLLAGITALSSVTVQSVITFLPLYFVARGESLLIATLIASIWLGIGVLGQLAGGYVSDRIGRRPIIVTSLLLGAVLFYSFLLTNGFVSLILLALSGAALYASWSVIVVMSSEAAPSNVGAVSGLMLGLYIGIGGVAALGFGAVADSLSLSAAFSIFTAFALVAGFLAIFLPRTASSGRAF